MNKLESSIIDYLTNQNISLVYLDIIPSKTSSIIVSVNTLIEGFFQMELEMKKSFITYLLEEASFGNVLKFVKITALKRSKIRRIKNRKKFIQNYLSDYIATNYANKNKNYDLIITYTINFGDYQIPFNILLMSSTTGDLPVLAKLIIQDVHNVTNTSVFLENNIICGLNSSRSECFFENTNGTYNIDDIDPTTNYNPGDTSNYNPDEVSGLGSEDISNYTSADLSYRMEIYLYFIIQLNHFVDLFITNNEVTDNCIIKLFEDFYRHINYTDDQSFARELIWIRDLNSNARNISYGMNANEQGFEGLNDPSRLADFSENITTNANPYAPRGYGSRSYPSQSPRSYPRNDIIYNDYPQNMTADPSNKKLWIIARLYYLKRVLYIHYNNEINIYNMTTGDLFHI
jgi:hypothetical protein